MLYKKYLYSIYNTMFETLNQHKTLLASVPIITYIVYIIYSFIRHLPTGFANLFFALFGFPLTILGQVVLFFVLKLAGKESYVPVIVLTLVAGYSIITTIQKMLVFKKVLVTTDTKIKPPVLTTTTTAKSS